LSEFSARRASRYGLANDQSGFLPLRRLLGLMEHAARELGEQVTTLQKYEPLTA
jgi:hypothetical protein